MRKESTVKNELVLAVVFILLASLFVCPSCGTPISVVDNKGKPAVSTQASEPPLANKDYENSFPLPYDRFEENNILGDFINGTNGWHSEIFQGGSGVEYFFLFKKGFDGFYMASLRERSGVDKLMLYLPVPSSAPVFFGSKEKAREVEESLNEAIDAGAAKRIDFEDYIFYSLSSYRVYQNLKHKFYDFCGWNLEIFEVKEDSPITNYIKAGRGYPTDWIRDTSNLAFIRESYKLDFNDPFWDKFSFGSKIKIYKKDGKFLTVKPVFEPTVAGEPSQCAFRFNNQGVFEEDWIRHYLSTNDYESLDEALKKESFEKLTEEEERYLMVF